MIKTTLTITQNIELKKCHNFSTILEQYLWDMKFTVLLDPSYLIITIYLPVFYLIYSQQHKGKFKRH